MAPYELYILQYEALNVIDNGFEAWMAATFAIVIVAHATGRSLTLKLRAFLSVLYVACAVLLYARYDSIMQDIFYYQSLMSAQDIRAPIRDSVEITSLIRKGVMVIGSLAAVAFLLIPRARPQNDSTID